MARRNRARVHRGAETVGAALGRIAARVDSWNEQRAAIAADIERLMTYAQSMLTNLEDAALGPSARPSTAPKNTGGRPRGYRMSEATTAKLRAAWRRRKAGTERKG